MRLDDIKQLAADLQRNPEISREEFENLKILKYLIENIIKFEESIVDFNKNLNMLLELKETNKTLEKFYDFFMFVGHV